MPREVEFTQFHVTNWPDHGVPNNVESIIEMLGAVRKKILDNNRTTNETQVGPKNKSPLNREILAVHCSAGCGRTGTIIAIDQVWTLLNENVKIKDIF